jgi:hypothetical protein
MRELYNYNLAKLNNAWVMALEILKPYIIDDFHRR